MEEQESIHHLLDNLHDEVMKAIVDDKESIQFGPYINHNEPIMDEIPTKLEQLIMDFSDRGYNISTRVEKKIAGVDGVPKDQRTVWIEVKLKF